MGRCTKIAGATVLLMAVAGMVIACGGGDDQGGGEEPVRIGVVLSITGAGGSLGEPEQDAVRLFQEELGEVEGRPVEWLIRDDESNPTTAVNTVNGLAQEEEVAAIIGSTITPTSLAIQQTVQRAEVPNVSLAASAAIVEPVEEKQLFFKTAQNDTLMVNASTDYMIEQGVGEIGFIGYADAFGEGGLAAFEQVTGNKDIELISRESFNREDTDVTAQLTSLRREEPEALAVWAIPPGANTVESDLGDLGMDTPVYHSHGVANRQFLELGGDAVEESILPSGKLIVADQLPDDDPQKEVLQEFTQRYEEEYGENTVNTFAGHAYDAMLIVHEAAGRAIEGGADPADVEDFRQSLRDEIENTSDLVGITGIFSFTPEDHAGLDRRSVAMVRVQNNDWELIEE